MHARLWLAVATGFFTAVWAVVLPLEPAQPLAAASQAFDTAVLPFVKRYCLDCHSGTDAERGVQLEKYRTAAAVSDDRATWGKVLGMLRARKMPPEGSRRPKDEEYDAVITWLEATLGQTNRAGGPDPGRSRSGVSTVPSTPIPFATCWASSSTPPPIFPPTTSAMGSTTSATCSRSRRC